MRSLAVAPEVAVGAGAVGINDVYRDTTCEERRFVRILWVDVKKQTAHVIYLGETAYPTAMPLEELDGRIAAGTLVWTSDHPFTRTPISRPLRIEGGGGGGAQRPVEVTRGACVTAKEAGLIEERRKLLAPFLLAAHDGSLFGKDFNCQISRLAQEANASRATVTRITRTWLEFGMNDAGLGTARKGSRTGPRTWTGPKPGKQPANEPGGVARTPEVLTAFAWGVKWLIAHPRNPRVDGYIAMRDQFFSEGTMMVGEVEIPKPIATHLIPSERQFARYCQKHLPDAVRERARRGERHWKLNVAPVLGTTSGWAFSPGSISHLDSALMAVNVADTATRGMNLGQPTLYFVLDDFSSVITGRHVTLAPESTEDALLAIADSMEGYIKAPRATPESAQQADLLKFKTREGFTDKGGAFLSGLTNSVHQRLGASVANPEGGRPNARARPEHRFHMCNMFTDYLPGAISKRRRGRGHLKRGQDASLIVGEYLQVVDEFIHFHNSTHRPANAPPESFLPDGRPRVAFDLLLWGIKHRGAPDRATEDEVRLCLYEQVEAVIDGHGHGIQAKGMFYQPKDHCPGLDMSRSGGRAKQKLTILRDRNRVGRAWLLVDRGAKAIELEATARSAPRAELTVAEWDAIRRLERLGFRDGRSEAISQRAAATAAVAPIAAGAVKLRSPKLVSVGTKGARAEETAAARSQMRSRLLPDPVPTEAPLPPRSEAPAQAHLTPPQVENEFRRLRARIKGSEHG